jgi:hypothetical protein
MNGRAKSRCSWTRHYHPRLESLEDRNLFSVGPNVDVNQPSTFWNNANGTIAINPTLPTNLFAAAEGHGGPMLAAYSPDGGATWIPSSLAGLPPPDPMFPNPRAAFDRFGNLFLAYRDGLVGGTWCAFSFNGGVSFAGAFSVVDVGTSRPSIATGPAPGGFPFPGQVTVAVTVPGAGVIAAAAPVFGPGLVAPFAGPVLVPGSIGGDFSSIGVGPVGQVLVTYENPSTIIGPSLILVNFDPALVGLAPFSPPVVVAATNVGFYPLPAQPTRIDAAPGLAWDQGTAYPPPDGAVYLVYTNSPAPGDPATNVYLQTSYNSGATWTPPVPVPDDPGPNSKFNPAIAVDQTTGDFAITWLDCRNDLGGGFSNDIDGVPNTDPEVYGMETVGGVIQPNVQVSAGPSNGPMSGDPTGLGYYDGVDFNSGVYYPIWADNDPYFSLTPANSFVPMLNMATAMVTPGPAAASRHESRLHSSPVMRSDSRIVNGVFMPVAPGQPLVFSLPDITISAASHMTPRNETEGESSPIVRDGKARQANHLRADARMFVARAHDDLSSLETPLLEDPLSAS